MLMVSQVVSLIQPNRLNGWFCEVFFMQVDEQYLRYHGCPLWLTVGPTEDLDDFLVNVLFARLFSGWPLFTERGSLQKRVFDAYNIVRIYLYIYRLI